MGCRFRHLVFGENPNIVFMPSELGQPQNRWGDGLQNVFVVRFKNMLLYDTPRFFPLDSDEVVCFPTDLHTFSTRIPKLCAPPRCFHRNVWSGLFQLRKGIMKILNRRSGKTENFDQSSVSIGAIPLETFNYIHIIFNSGIESLLCHVFRSSETYLHIDSSLTRSKIKMSFETGMIRFESFNDLDMLRRLLGIASVYGSTESKPTLVDGKAGRTLKRGHTLTVVKGNAPEELSPQKIQRVDLSFSPFAVKVTVAYEHYIYDCSRGGILVRPPPTKHLHCLLTCTPYVNEEDDSETESSSESSEDEPETPKAPNQVASPNTIQKILNSVPSKDDSEEDDFSIHPHHDTIQFNFGETTIYQGDQFFKDGTVYEMVCLFDANETCTRTILLDTLAMEYFTSFKEPTNHKKLEDRALKIVGTIPPRKNPTYACLVVGGKKHSKDKPASGQEVMFIEHSEDVLASVAAYS